MLISQKTRGRIKCMHMEFPYLIPLKVLLTLTLALLLQAVPTLIDGRHRDDRRACRVW